MKYITIILYVITSTVCFAQELNQDFLNKMGDEPLLSLFDARYGDSIAQEKIARTYLDRARKQKDTIKMARGYDRLARTFHPEKNIAFADSVLMISANLKHKFYPVMGYFLKAYNHQLLNDFYNYFIQMQLGYKYAVEVENLTLQTYAANNLVFYKSIFGDPKGALKFQRETHDLITSEYYKRKIKDEKRDTKSANVDSIIAFDLVKSYQNYTHCFINMKQLDSAKYYNKKFRHVIDTINLGYLNNNFISWHQATQMEIAFFDKKFNKTVSLGNSYINNDSISKSLNYPDLLIYLGLAQYRINDKKNAITNLTKVDSIFENKGMLDFLPYERRIYKVLLEDSKNKKNFENEIKYLNKLILVDSILKKKFLFFESNFIKQIETPKLLAKKDDEILKLKNTLKSPDPKFYIALGALSISLCFLFYFLRKRVVYKKRFKLLLANQLNNPNKIKDTEYHNELSATIVEDVLEKLKQFEVDKGYLRSDLTLHKLAKRCKTNSNYLSRVINLKIEKNFSQYLHGLRIEYVMTNLFTNKVYRKYTIKAIAEECGYKSAESFSKAFYKIHGIYPSYYIKKIERGEV